MFETPVLVHRRRAVKTESSPNTNMSRLLSGLQKTFLQSPVFLEESYCVF